MFFRYRVIYFFPLTPNMDHNDIQIAEESQNHIVVSLTDGDMDIVSSLMLLVSAEPVSCSVFNELVTFLEGLKLEDRTYFWTMMIQMQHFEFDSRMVAPFVTKAVAKFGIMWKIVYDTKDLIPTVKTARAKFLYGAYHLVQSLKDKVDLRPLASLGFTYSKKRQRLEDQDQTNEDKGDSSLPSPKRRSV